MKPNIFARNSLVGLRLLALTALLLFLAGCPAETPPPPVLVGHVLLSNDAEQQIGESTKRGVALAVKDFNNGEELRPPRPVTVLHALAKGTRRGFEAQAVRLVHINQVAALLGGWNAEQTAGLRQAPVPVVSPSGLRDRQKGAAIFLTGLSLERKGQVLAQAAAEQFAGLSSPLAAADLIGTFGALPWPFSLANMTGVGGTQELPLFLVLVDQRRAENTAAADAFVKELASLTKTANFQRPPIRRYTSDTELEDLLGRLEDEKADAVFLAGDTDAVAKVRSRLKNMPIFFAGPEGSCRTLLTGRETRHNIWLATAWLPDVDTALNKHFIQQYQQTHGEKPDTHAALAYDNARILFEAIRQSEGNFSSAQVEKQLSELADFDSLTGKTSFNAHRILERPAFVVRLQEGRTVLVSGE